MKCTISVKPSQYPAVFPVKSRIYRLNPSIIVISLSIYILYLQVVSFDSEWREVYVGYIRKDVFTGECPNEVNNAAKISVKYDTKDRPENAVISAAKW